MNEPGNDEPMPPTGFEPPTDVNVPWFAWVLWPVGMLAALLLTAILFRGCAGFFG